MVNYIIITTIHAASIHALMKLLFNHIIDGFTLGDIKICNPIPTNPIQIDGREWASSFYFTIDTTLGRSFRSIRTLKPPQRAKRSQLATTGLCQPQQEINVMTTFGNQHRIGFGLFSPHTTHKTMCGAIHPNGRTMIDGNDVSKYSRIHQFLDFHEIRMMSKYMTYRYKHPLLLGCFTDGHTFLQSLGYWFFQ